MGKKSQRQTLDLTRACLNLQPAKARTLDSETIKKHVKMVELRGVKIPKTNMQVITMRLSALDLQQGLVDKPEFAIETWARRLVFTVRDSEWEVDDVDFSTCGPASEEDATKTGFQKTWVELVTRRAFTGAFRTTCSGADGPRLRIRMCIALLDNLLVFESSEGWQLDIVKRLLKLARGFLCLL